MSDLVSHGEVIREEMIQIFDACLAQQTPRKDIIELFMDTTHKELIERFRFEWQARALKLDPIEIFELLHYTYEYNQILTRFGIKDDEIENGYKTLCNAYKIKIHVNIYPLITNILMKEREIEIEKESDGTLYTHSSNDIFKIFISALDNVQMHDT